MAAFSTRSAEIEAALAERGTSRDAASAVEKQIAALDTREAKVAADRSEEHTSELQSLMRISYAVFCLKKKKEITKKAHNMTPVPLQDIPTPRYQQEDSNK